MKEIAEGHATSSQIIVLMYHRIDNTDTDPWGICVSPENFEKQIQFLKNNFNVINTDAVINNVNANMNAENAVCITFDDGYADNYIQAKPILEKYNCAATFFISTVFLNQTKPFWWDELELIFLTSKKLPGYLLLQIAGNIYEFTLDENKLIYEKLFQHKKWKWYEAPLTDRCGVFMDLWEKLRTLQFEEIKMQLHKIREWSGYNYECRFPMNKQQLSELSKNNLFTIGLHTHSHPDLQSKEKQIQVEEIKSCKKILSSEYGVKGNYLAYPYGRYNADTIELVKSLGFDACFTTEQNIININSDKHRLGRYQVFDWDIATFTAHINCWMNKPVIV